MANYIYICPKCGSISGFSKGVEGKCSDCGSVTIPTDIAEYVWYAKPKDERERIKNAYITGGKEIGMPPAFNAADSSNSGWVSLLRGVVTVWLVLGCIASLVTGILVGSLFRGGAGFFAAIVIIAVGVLLSFVSVAAIMVFLDMSSDIRSIKQMLEKAK